jgi:4-amino-4-deoxy-L-arabinose transferase-like glycosyltransferase
MIYQYAAAPLVAMAGLNEWTLRLPAALFATATVVFAFLLGRRLTGDARAGLWAMALLAMSPWHLVFSRWAQQGIFVPFFFSAGLLCFLSPPKALCALDRNRAKRRAEDRMRLGVLWFGLAFYSYSGARPFLLLIWAWMIFLWRREIWRERRTALRIAPLAILALVPTFYAMLGQGAAGMGRFQRLSVFAMDAPLLERVGVFLMNYLAHFDPRFLFVSGDALPRHGLPGFGVLLHVELVFLTVGLIIAFRRRGRMNLLLLGWFVFAPVSAALTREGIPHALRTLHATPAPQLIGAIGAVAVADYLARKAALLRWIPPTATALNGAAVLFVLFVIYPAWSAPWFEYGAREAFQERERAVGARPVGGSPLVHIQAGGVPPGGNLPYCVEFYLYHARVAPELIQGGGLAGVPIRIYPWLEMMKDQLGAQECLIAPSPAYHQYYARRQGAQRPRSIAILFPRHPWSKAPSEALRLVVGAEENRPASK